MSLIIRDLLVVPPTWLPSFRDLTLYCHIFLHAPVVIESNDPDLFWKAIHPRGGMDFVEDFVRPGTEQGLHLDIEPRFPQTLVVGSIQPENLHQIIARIRFCSGLA